MKLLHYVVAIPSCFGKVQTKWNLLLTAKMSAKLLIQLLNMEWLMHEKYSTDKIPLRLLCLCVRADLRVIRIMFILLNLNRAFFNGIVFSDIKWNRQRSFAKTYSAKTVGRASIKSDVLDNIQRFQQRKHSLKNEETHSYFLFAKKLNVNERFGRRRECWIDVQHSIRLISIIPK